MTCAWCVRTLVCSERVGAEVRSGSRVLQRDICPHGRALCYAPGSHDLVFLRLSKLLLEDTWGWTTFCLAFGASGRHHILSSVVPSSLHNFWVFEEDWFYVDKSVCINLHTVWFPFSECNGLRERLHRFRPSGVWHISYGDGHWGRGGLHPVPICDGDVEVMSRWSLPIRLNNQRQKM